MGTGKACTNESIKAEQINTHWRSSEVVQQGLMCRGPSNYMTAAVISHTNICYRRHVPFRRGRSKTCMVVCAVFEVRVLDMWCIVGKGVSSKCKWFGCRFYSAMLNNLSMSRASVARFFSKWKHTSTAMQMMELVGIKVWKVDGVGGFKELSSNLGCPWSFCRPLQSLYFVVPWRWITTYRC